MAILDWEYTRKHGEERKSSQLEEVKEVIADAIDRARDILENEGSIKERAEAYWLAQIEVELNKSHRYLASSMCTLEDTINELTAKEEAEDNEEMFKAENELDAEQSDTPDD